MSTTAFAASAFAQRVRAAKEIVTEDRGRFGVKRDVERSPEQIDATACERRRVIWIPPEFRPAVIRRSSPSIREWPVAVLGVERPDVEVQIVEGGPLVQRLADKPVGVTSRTLQVARN